VTVPGRTHLARKLKEIEDREWCQVRLENKQKSEHAGFYPTGNEKENIDVFQVGKRHDLTFS
jgi:hypothetical protein